MKKYKRLIPYVIALSVFETFILTIINGLVYAMTHDIEELNNVIIIANQEMTYKQALILITFIIIMFCICELVKGIFNYLFNKAIEEYKNIKKKDEN